MLSVMKTMQIHVNIRSTLGTTIVFLKDWVWFLTSIVIASKLRGYCIPNQNLACFVLHLKIINSIFKMRYAPYTKFSKKLKNGIEIEVGQAVLELIKTLFGLFWSITLKNRLAAYNFNAVFEFLGQFAYIIFRKNFEITHKTCYF